MIPAAWPYVIPLTAIGLLLAAFGLPAAAVLPLALAAGVAFFFRDPERTAPGGEEQIVSPADGRVVEISPETEAGQARIAIFLSLLNVHVNRSPVSGTVSEVTYTPGAFKPAFDARASSVNERNTLVLSAAGATYRVSQIAGLIARRITCFKKPGDQVRRGERIGYISFGSRTELTLPPGASIVVGVGDSVRGGETIVARLGEVTGGPSA